MGASCHCPAFSEQPGRARCLTAPAERESEPQKPRRRDTPPYLSSDAVERVPTSRGQCPNAPRRNPFVFFVFFVVHPSWAFSVLRGPVHAKCRSSLTKIGGVDPSPAGHYALGWTRTRVS